MLLIAHANRKCSETLQFALMSRRRAAQTIGDWVQKSRYVNHFSPITHLLRRLLPLLAAQQRSIPSSPALEILPDLVREIPHRYLSLPHWVLDFPMPLECSRNSVISPILNSNRQFCFLLWKFQTCYGSTIYFTL